MNAPLPAGLRAALAAGRHLHTKDGLNLDPLLKAMEENNRIAQERFKQIETSREADADRLDEIERKANRAGLYGAGGGGTAPSWGEQFVKSPELKSFAQETSRPGRLRLEVKTTITSATGSGASLTTPQRDDVLLMQKRELTIRDLIPTIQVSSNSVEYPRQTSRPTGALSVAEGDLKPESAMGFDLVSTPIRTLAHWVPASLQILSDAPQLRDLINSELLYGLKSVEEQQLLLGSGVGQNLNGLTLQATAYAAPFTYANANLMDVIALALLQCSLAEFQPDAIVLHPSDWLRIKLLKDAGGLYLIQSGVLSTPKQLFGLPVVTTTAMPAGKFLVGAFQVAATIYDRWDARVEVSTEHADFFVRNLCAVRAEERLGLAVKRPAALIYGTFPTT